VFTNRACTARDVRVIIVAQSPVTKVNVGCL
jgi:hypothetical protein